MKDCSTIKKRPGGVRENMRRFPWVSPARTWEGKPAAAFLVAYFVSHYFIGFSMAGGAVIAFIIVLMGSYGDLIKSLIKHSLNVKDSAMTLPGHSGMPDRFDTLLVSAPFVFSYLILFPYA